MQQGGKIRRRGLAVSALAATTALVLSGQAAAATCAPWRNVPIPGPAGEAGAGMLAGVAAHSAANAIAVGDGGQHAFSLRWRGDGPWRAVGMPTRGQESELSDVARIPGTNDYWGVGSYETNAGETRSHITRWTGMAWTIVPSPSVAGFETRLRGVTALSATNAWAVGSYTSFSQPPSFTLVLHWNGTRWRIVESPSPLPPSAPEPSDPPVANLNDALAFSSGSVWTVGDMSYPQADEDRWPLILRRDAPDWRVFPVPQTSWEDTLESLSALSPRDLWTVGWAFDAGDEGVEPLAFRWNGQFWTKTALPPQGDEDRVFLFGVESLSPSKTWAVGRNDLDVTGSDPPGALVYRWNGTSWRDVSIDAPPNSRLFDVTHVANTEITWAVGGVLLGPQFSTTPLIQRHC